MGILGLLPFLKDHECLGKFTGWPEGSKITIDVPIFAHKFIYTERTYENMSQRFLLFAEELRAKKCEPIFVFDGSRLELKDQERQRRSVARARTQVLQKIKRSEAIEALQDSNIEIVTAMDTSEGLVQPDYAEVFTGIMVPTKKEYESLKELLDTKGYLTRQAKYEAEALCAYLVSTGEAWASITEDTDSLAFGSPRTIFKYFSEEPLIAELPLILHALKLTQDQFIDLCCLFGTDFCENVYKIGPKGSYKLITKHGSWANIYSAERLGFAQRTRESAEAFNETYEKAFTCFKTSCFEC